MSAEAPIDEHRPRPKKARAASRRFRQAILDIVAEYERMTVRQLYYQLVSRGVIEKTDRKYKDVVYHCGQLRFGGEIAYSKIVDGSRERHRAVLFDGIPDALDVIRAAYRRDCWTTQPRRVEIWTEKQALAGIIEPICDQYGIAFVAVRGTPSLSLLWSSAEDMTRSGKPTKIFYLGDHDPTGREIDGLVQTRLAGHGADFEFERLAVTPDQVEQYGLLTRPGKDTDNRLAKFAEEFGSGDCVEVDAIPPDVLEQLVRNAIESCILRSKWRRMVAVEKAERKALADFASGWKP